MKTVSGSGGNFKFGVAMGQVLAFLLSVSGSMVELIGSRSSPLFLVSVTYFCIFCSQGIALYFFGQRSRTPVWKFSLVAVIDTAASYAAVVALSLTSVTSWSLIQPANLLVVVPMSSLLLKARYSWKHLLSGLLAIAGLSALLLTDVGDERKDVVSGDLLALLSCLLYGLSQVLIEWLIKKEASPAEVLTLMSGYGIVFAGALSVVLGEWWPDVSYPVGVYVATSSLSTSALYATMPLALRHAGAAALTISLLATSLWSVLGKLLIMGDFHPNVAAFVCSFGMIVGGVTLFALSGDPYEQQYLPLDGNGETAPVFNVELPER